MTSNSSHCIPGEWVPYPSTLPPPTITENISVPFIVTFPTWEVGLKSFFYSVAMAMAVIGNIIVILTVVLNKRLHSSTNIYLLNLALSGLGVGALNMWMHLLAGIFYSWPFDDVMCKLYSFLQMLWLTGSALFMTVIACERYVAIIHPLRARLSKPWQHGTVMLAVWLVAALVAVPNILVRSTQELIWADYHQVVVTYFVPILFMTLAYARIVYELKCRTLPGEQVEKVVESHRKTNHQVIRMLIMVLIVFAVCWTPQEIFVLIDATDPYTGTQTSEDLKYALIYIAYFNSSLNPVLYAGLNRNLRTAFIDMISCQNRRRRTTSSNKIHPTSNGHTITITSAV